MKNIWYLYYTVFTIIMVGLCYHYFPSYPETPTECKVLQTYQTSAGYKVSAKFILVLEDPKNRRFDIKVSPTTFYEASSKGHICLMLNETDIDHSKQKTGLMMLLMCSGVIFFAIWLILGISLILE